MNQKKRTAIFATLVLFIGVVFFVQTVTPFGAQFHPPGEITPQGNGSGLDSDTVDGLHAADLIAAGATDQPITLYGTTTCPAGFTTMTTGSLAKFTAVAATGGTGVVEPALNVFACVGSSVTTCTNATTGAEQPCSDADSSFNGTQEGGATSLSNADGTSSGTLATGWSYFNLVGTQSEVGSENKSSISCAVCIAD